MVFVQHTVFDDVILAVFGQSTPPALAGIPPARVLFFDIKLLGGYCRSGTGLYTKSERYKSSMLSM